MIVLHFAIQSSLDIISTLLDASLNNTGIETEAIIFSIISDIAGLSFPPIFRSINRISASFSDNPFEIKASV